MLANADDAVFKHLCHEAYNSTNASSDKSEEGSVTLQVTDSLTGEPILGAVVKIATARHTSPTSRVPAL